MWFDRCRLQLRSRRFGCFKCVLLDPASELFSSHVTSGNRKDDSFLFVDMRIQLMSVEQEENFKRGVADALVAIDERVIRDERKAEGHRLLDDRCVKVRSVEALPGLSDRGFEESEIPYADSSAGNGSDTFVENQDFAQREVSGHARRR